MKEEMDGEVFISRQSWHSSFIGNMTEVFSPLCTLIWPVNNYVSRQDRGINRRNESTIDIIKIVGYGTVLIFSETLTVCFDYSLFGQNKWKCSPLL